MRTIILPDIKTDGEIEAYMRTLGITGIVELREIVYLCMLNTKGRCFARETPSGEHLIISTALAKELAGKFP